MKCTPALIFALFLASVPQFASAYLDPGTGSMALQLLIAGLLGAIFTIKTWWRSIVAFFSKKTDNSSSTK